MIPGHRKKGKDRRPADAAAEAALLSGAPGVGRITRLMNRGCARYSCLEHDPFLVKIPEVPLTGSMGPSLYRGQPDGRVRLDTRQCTRRQDIYCHDELRYLSVADARQHLQPRQFAH